LPVGALFKPPFGLVDILIENEPRAPREVDEEQHVARRQRGDERFLGVDSGGVIPRRRHDVRAGTRRNDRAAVERPLVRAAVLALGEVPLARALPADDGGVGAHGAINPSAYAVTNKPINPNQIPARAWKMTASQKKPGSSA